METDQLLTEENAASAQQINQATGDEMEQTGAPEISESSGEQTAQPFVIAHGLNPAQLSPLTLAFVGDSVFELKVRTRLAMQGSMPVGKLHAKAIVYVSAKGQAAVTQLLLPLLTPQEQELFRRGRNANGAKPPKNTDFAEYRLATGLETLFGWLYLTGQAGRIDTLFAAIWEERTCQAAQALQSVRQK